MKRFLMLLMAAAVGMCISSCGGNDEDYTTIGTSGESGSAGFAVLNKLGSTIEELYISDSSTSNWGEDLLATSSLDDGVQLDVAFSGAPLKSTIFDMAIIMTDGKEYQFKSIDISAMQVIELQMTDGGPVANRP